MFLTTLEASMYSSSFADIVPSFSQRPWLLRTMKLTVEVKSSFVQNILAGLVVLAIAKFFQVFDRLLSVLF